MKEKSLFWGNICDSFLAIRFLQVWCLGDWNWMVGASDDAATAAAADDDDGKRVTQCFMCCKEHRRIK